MKIKEQIEIARMIASGTPREVAILEQVRKMAKDEDRSGAIEVESKPDPSELAKKRAAAAKARQDELSAKAKEIQDRKNVERLRRSKHKT